MSVIEMIERLVMAHCCYSRQSALDPRRPLRSCVVKSEGSFTLKYAHRYKSPDNA